LPTRTSRLLDSGGRVVSRFFIDPLSVKELSGIARRWQTYIGRCVYVGLISVIVWIFWSNLSRGGGWMSPSAYAELGRSLFYSFYVLQMVVVTFGGISAGSDMITREIRGGTLGLLALTPQRSAVEVWISAAFHFPVARQRGVRGGDRPAVLHALPGELRGVDRVVHPAAGILPGTDDRAGHHRGR